MTDMRVRVFQIGADGRETFQAECDLSAALPEPDDEQALAYQALRDHGEYRGGGGAAPLFVEAAREAFQSKMLFHNPPDVCEAYVREHYL